MDATTDNVALSDTDNLDANPIALKRAHENTNQDTPPSLRPHTLMIDLLFGALMLFAFQMGDPNSATIIPKDFDIPTSSEKTPKKNQRLLAIKPVKTKNSGWSYELPSGKRLSAEAVIKMIKSEKRTPVLLVPSDARVQSYIDAEQPLRRLGIKAGLAVAMKQGTEK
jgi:hypothetical protein